jgi:hypothetical protein
MEKPHIGRYGVLVAFVVLLNTGMVWAQANEGNTSTSQECSTVMRAENRLAENVNAQPLVTDGVMVAEDMRCRQCRGKCTADNLRCRSQCLGDSACLAQCEERKSTCETTCKQLFSCE